MLKRFLSLLGFLLVFGWNSQAQYLTTVPPLTGGISGIQGITFNLAPQVGMYIDTIWCRFTTGGSTDVWYNPNPINQTTSPTISAANGWIQIVNGATSTAGFTGIPMPAATSPLFSGGSVYGFYVGAPAGCTSGCTSVEYTMYTTANPDTFSNSDLVIRTGPNCGFGGGMPNPPNYPRQFNGAISYHYATGTDIGVAGLLNPTAPFVASSTSPVSINIRCNASNTLTSASVGYQLDNNTPITGSWTGNLTTGQTATYNFTTPLTLPSTGTHILKTWARNPNGVSPDLNPYNDTLVTLICFGLPGGTYTVGAGKQFSTLADAISAINCGGIIGNVTFKLDPGVHTGPFSINGPLPGTNTYSMTFQSANNNAATTIISAASGAAFRSKNIDNINFRHLGFERTGTTFSTQFDNALCITGSNAGSVVGCKMRAEETSTSSYNIPLNLDNVNNFLVDSSVAVNGYYGIRLNGTNAAHGNSNIISNTTMDSFYYYGLYAYYQDLLNVENNTITNAGKVTNAYAYGMYLGYDSNFNVNNNKIIGNIPNTGIYVYNFDGDVNSSPNYLVNNVISGTVVGSGTPTGISLSGYYFYSATNPDTTDYIGVYHNTVNLVTSTTTTTNDYDGAIYITGSGIQQIDLVNNNLISSPAPGNTAYPVQWRPLILQNQNALDSTILNNNNYYFGPNNEISRLNGVAYATLAAHQFNKSDASSVSLDPNFLAPNYPKPLSSALNNLGTPSFVATDVTGATRNANTPDIGAYEFSPLATEGSMSGIDPIASSCGLGLDTIIVTVNNIGLNSLSNIPVYYSINNGTPVAATIAGPVASGASTTFAFPTLANFSTIGNYNIKSWIKITGDANGINDSAFTSVTNIPTITKPDTTTFDTNNGYWTVGGKNSTWEWGAPNGTVVNTPASAPNVWTTGLTKNYNANELSWVTSPCYNISSITKPVVRFDMNYRTENTWDGVIMEISTDGGANWVMLGQQGSGTNWYDGTINRSYYVGNAWENQSQGWVKAMHSLDSVKGASQLMFRFHMYADGAVQYDGFAFDNFEVIDSMSLVFANDMAITKISDPRSGCGLGSSEPLTIDVVNYGSQTKSNIPVGITINGGAPITGTIAGPLASGAATTYTFGTTGNFSATGNYNIVAYTGLANDQDKSNDTIAKVVKSLTGVTVSIADSNNFDTNNGGWTAGGATPTSTPWQWGTPNKTIITSASSAPYCWVTDTTNKYATKDTAWVESQCYDVSNMVATKVGFDFFYDVEDGYDGVNLQYSTDGGDTWEVLGDTSTSTNWYNQVFTSGNINMPVWSGDNSGWLHAEHDVKAALNGAKSVRFRFVLYSDPSVAQEGFAFDNFKIFDTVGFIPTRDGSVTRVITPIVGSKGTSISPQVVVKNTGTMVLNAFDVSVTVNGTPALTQSFVGVLIPGDSTTFQFSNAYNFTSTGSKNICVFTLVPGDANRRNDTLCFNIISNVATHNLDNMVNIYPNPANTSVTVDLGTAYQKGTFELMNTLGQVVCRRILDGNVKQNINIEGTNNGVYLYRITLDGATTQGKLMIQH